MSRKYTFVRTYPSTESSKWPLTGGLRRIVMLPALGDLFGMRALGPYNLRYTMPIIDLILTDDELAAVTVAVRRTLDADEFPLAPRLKPLRSALAKPDPASISNIINLRLIFETHSKIAVSVLTGICSKV